MVFIYEYILCFITNLKLLFGNSAWYRDIDCNTFREKHTYISLDRIGDNRRFTLFCGGLLHRLIFRWHDRLQRFGLTVFALRAVRLYRLVRHSSYAAQDSVSSKNETVVSYTHHFRDAV